MAALSDEPGASAAQEEVEEPEVEEGVDAALAAALDAWDELDCVDGAADDAVQEKEDTKEPAAADQAPGARCDLTSVLPRELLLRACAFLSAEDLARACMASRQLRSVCEEQVLWRRLFCARWGRPHEHQGQAPWKVLYQQKDLEDRRAMERTLGLAGGAPAEGDDLMRRLYMDMQRARRQQTLGRGHVDDQMEVPLGALEEQLAAWRRQYPPVLPGHPPRRYAPTQPHHPPPSHGPSKSSTRPSIPSTRAGAGAYPNHPRMSPPHSHSLHPSPPHHTPSTSPPPGPSTSPLLGAPATTTTTTTASAAAAPAARAQAPASRRVWHANRSASQQQQVQQQQQQRPPAGHQWHQPHRHLPPPPDASAAPYSPYVRGDVEEGDPSLSPPHTTTQVSGYPAAAGAQPSMSPPHTVLEASGYRAAGGAQPSMSPPHAATQAVGGYPTVAQPSMSPTHSSTQPAAFGVTSEHPSMSPPHPSLIAGAQLPTAPLAPPHAPSLSPTPPPLPPATTPPPQPATGPAPTASQPALSSSSTATAAHDPPPPHNHPANPPPPDAAAPSTAAGAESWWHQLPPPQQQPQPQQRWRQQTRPLPSLPYRPAGATASTAAASSSSSAAGASSSSAHRQQQQQQQQGQQHRAWDDSQQACRPPLEQQGRHAFSWDQIGGKHWGCREYGWVHLCDGTCREGVIDTEHDLVVCPISGRSIERMMSEWEVRMLARQRTGPVGHDEMGHDFTGALVRAYERGYDCRNESELEKRCGVRLR